MIDFLGLGILGILGLAFVLNLVLLYLAIYLFKWIYELLLRLIGIEVIIKRKDWMQQDFNKLSNELKKKELVKAYNKKKKLRRNE